MTSSSGGESGSVPPPDSKVKRFCRVCQDFKSFIRQGLDGTAKTTQKPLKAKQESAGEATSSEAAEPISASTATCGHQLECPADKSELGRASWTLLHTLTANLPQTTRPEEREQLNRFLDSFSMVYPCVGCRRDMQCMIKSDPPPVQSAEALAQWMCRLHNRVNRKLGKPEFDCGLVNQRWRDGWDDGSCD